MGLHGRDEGAFEDEFAGVFVCVAAHEVSRAAVLGAGGACAVFDADVGDDAVEGVGSVGAGACVAVVVVFVVGWVVFAGGYD